MYFTFFGKFIEQPLCPLSKSGVKHQSCALIATGALPWMPSPEGPCFPFHISNSVKANNYALSSDSSNGNADGLHVLRSSLQRMMKHFATRVIILCLTCMGCIARVDGSISNQEYNAREQEQNERMALLVWGGCCCWYWLDWYKRLIYVCAFARLVFTPGFGRGGISETETLHLKSMLV